MTPFTTPLASCDANTNDVTWWKKQNCSPFWLSSPKEFSGTMYETMSITRCQCLCHRHYVTKSYVTPHFDQFDLRSWWCHLQCHHHHMMVMPATVASCDMILMPTTMALDDRKSHVFLHFKCLYTHTHTHTHIYIYIYI